jgi:hypothetical protein
MLRALYGMLIASILYYKKFRKDIEEIGLHVNPYDPCVADCQVRGKQHTVTWHVDDLKSIHVDPEVNDEFYAWLERTYGSEELGHVTTTRGPTHEYLAMKLDYSTPGVLKVDMTEYISSMLAEFPYKLQGEVHVPWTEKLFKVDETSKKLDDKRRETFHSFVMKAMFLCKRARSDVQPAISFLASRVQEPNEGDWTKLIRVLVFLKTTRDEQKDCGYPMIISSWSLFLVVCGYMLIQCLFCCNLVPTLVVQSHSKSSEHSTGKEPHGLLLDDTPYVVQHVTSRVA